MKHDEALAALQAKFENVVDGGLVIDDPAYETADAAYAKLAGLDLDCLIVCVAGWIPTHAVIRVTDHFRHIPMLLWGLCGWKENGRIITTAEQAGTTAIRPAFEALEYNFKYVYNVIGKEWPMDKIFSSFSCHDNIVVGITELPIFGHCPLECLWLVKDQLHMQLAFTIQNGNLLFQCLYYIVCQRLVFICPYTMPGFNSFL